MNSSIPIADSIRETLSLISVTPGSIALYTALAAVLPLVYTFVTTSLNAGKPTKDGEPPVPPYWIPFLGHAFSLMGSMNKLHNGYRKMDGRLGKPRTLFVFGQRIYFITDPASILSMWRKGKTVVFEPLTEFVLRNLFGTTDSCIKVVSVGLPGIDQTGLEGQLGWSKIIHKWYLQELNLGTTGLEGLTRQFIRELNVELEKQIGNDFHEVDLFAWVKGIMFQASGRALYGHKLRMDDEFVRNFWKWDSGFLQLARLYPDFLIPGVRAARSKVLDEFVRWRLEVQDFAEDIDDDVTWEENLGARLVRNRVKLNRQVFAEDDHIAHASIHVSLFWGLEANAIPTTCWMIAHILFTPGLLKKLRNEVASCTEDPVKGSSLPTFDVEKLTKLPLLNAVWQETLRLGVSALSPRIVLEDTEIDGYMYKKGGMIQGLSLLVQMEEEYWGKDVNEFNPDRWLPYPGEDPTVATKRIREFQSKLRPFGGGTTVCPGRHFASQEIQAIVAVLVTAFEWDTAGGKVPEVNRDFFGAGGLPAKGDVKIRFRRRV
ncbi:hypothetical protein TWF569_008506 [Orbilia oligospora]|uniref:Cytochrome P450 n=2 Tax=Orbilia oligospora TaxID=2813651 RepID=A0A7C8NYX5_ORBOL|nr:hypothetical protein TWF706_009035 [Orbilia oligospora]KAF3102069.1 hypothetical protein TWF103_007716 [Orbilia oligospora]KAF3105993.1 hypothetical protein TWF102_001893 [Orbilia oligospora]KAF3139656.1 hypothetical protein TWF569_008506 [Orbilia oligospora]KAF3141701.1 hypothetical protein TWF703_001723 [Orbilia oligospora]